MTEHIAELHVQPLLDGVTLVEEAQQPSDLSVDELAVVAGGPYIMG